MGIVIDIDSNALIQDVKHVQALKEMILSIDEGTDTVNDNIINTYINSVSAMIRSYYGYDLLKQDYTDIYLDGSGKRNLMIPQWPVNSITSVEEDGTALTEGTDYDLYSPMGYLRKDKGSIWLEGNKTIKLTYNAGYILVFTDFSLPRDIQLACIQQIAAEYDKFKSKGWNETARTMPDGSITRLSDALLPSVVRLLKPHKRPTI
jgi:hypothetical protein